MRVSSGKQASQLSEHLCFAGAAIVSSFVLACWTLLSHYETTNWERFFFVIGGGTAGFLWLTTVAFRDRRKPRMARTAAIVLPAAALKVSGHFAWYQLLDSRYEWSDSALQNGLWLGLGYWLAGAMVIYGVLAMVYRKEPVIRPAARDRFRIPV